MISVVLVNWNGWADTISCIQSLLISSPTEARIIVVDNASTNESIKIFRCWSEGGLCPIREHGLPESNLITNQAVSHSSCFVNFDDQAQCFNWDEIAQLNAEAGLMPIYFVRGSINGGFGYGCNIGMRLARQLGTDAIWLLNNDCVVSPDSLLKLHDHILQHPNEIVGTYLKYFYEPDRIQAVGGGKIKRLTGKFALHTNPSFEEKLDYIHGASMAFPVSCLEKVGFFDQKIFMYCEEVDYCLRAASVGYKFDVLPVDVFHKEAGSQGNSPSVNAWTQVLVNKHYVLRKNLGWGMWVFFFFAMLGLRSLLPVGQRAARQGARRALAYFIFGKAV